MRVYFTNLGCKLNQAEVDRMARDFLAAGHDLAGTVEDADVHVINSCTVTHLAARDSRKTARRGARRHAERGSGPLRTVMTGCYATEAPEEVAAVAGVDLVVPNPDKDALLERVHQAFPEFAPPPGEEGVPVPYVPLDFGHARALVKVEDGCNMGCSFCIIPSTRGRQRSRPVEEVVDEVRLLTAGGYPEIVVTGVQISEYRDLSGGESGERRLYDLVRAILDETDVPRLRLTSIAPWKFDDRLLELWQDPRLCRHLHMSLQSGSTSTLRRMRRPYSAEQYAALVEKIRAAIPSVAITTDVIVGFPGETEEEFAESLAFVERMGFAKPHVFTYSERAGTPAAELPGAVAHAVKKGRTARMLEVARAGEQAFYAERVGEVCEVVWEERRSEFWTGVTDHYVRVRAQSAEDLAGRTTPARLVEVVDGGMAADVS